MVDFFNGNIADYCTIRQFGEVGEVAISLMVENFLHPFQRLVSHGSKRSFLTSMDEDAPWYLLGLPSAILH